MTDDKFLLLKRHVASEGLSDEIVREITDKCEFVRVEPGELLHRAGEVFHSVYLLIHGRVLTSIMDPQGRVMVQRHQSAGVQFGALAAALGEPAQMDLIAKDPSTLLRLD